MLNHGQPKETETKRYVIERNIPRIGSKTRRELKEAAKVSNKALAELAPDIQWVESFVAAGKTFCVYLATDEDVVSGTTKFVCFEIFDLHPVNKVVAEDSEFQDRMMIMPVSVEYYDVYSPRPVLAAYPATSY